MKELICIVCPVGCHLHVDDKNNITGNQCPRGLKYGLEEITHPSRIITTTVKTSNPMMPRLPVKTSSPIPKELMFQIMDRIGSEIVTKSVKINDVIIKNVLDTQIDIIATRSLNMLES